MPKSHLDMLGFAAQTWLIEPEAGSFLMAQLVSSNLLLALEGDDDPLHFADSSWIYYPTAEKAGSTAILNVTGVLYDYYANYLCAKLDLIYADPNVSKLVVRLNGPGGAANAGNKLADKLEAAPLPTTAYIDYGMAASAHYMLACACDQIYASRSNDLVGSIGTLISYQDWSKYFDKMGIVSKELYATQSTEKNEEMRQAAQGKFDLLQQRADAEAGRFIDYVKARRPGVDASTLKGRLFNAAEGQSLGLLDGIGDLKAAVKAATTTTLNATPRTTMIFGYQKVEKLMALKSIEASALTTEMVKAANEELAGLGINGVALISQAEFTSLMESVNADASNATALATAQATAQAEVTRLTTELATRTTERDTYKTKAEEYGAKAGDEKTTVVKNEETQADAGDTNSASTIANLPHNRALDGNPLFN